MENKRMPILFVWIITSSYCACINIPFTHDFNIGMRDWTCDTKDWKHSKWNPPDTSNVPLFSSDGAYFWTDTSTQTRDSQGKNTELVSRSITPVTKATKFHFSYWFYTSNSNSTDAVGIYFYHILKNPPKPRVVDAIMAINTSSNMWEEATIDCQHQNCCEFGYDCKIAILIGSYFESVDGYSFMAIRCVSTEENGCSRPHKSVMANASPGHSTTQKPSFANTVAPLTTHDGPNVLIIQTIIVTPRTVPNQPQGTRKQPPTHKTTPGILSLFSKITSNTSRLHDGGKTESNPVWIWRSNSSYWLFIKLVTRLFL